MKDVRSILKKEYSFSGDKNEIHAIQDLGFVHFLEKGMPFSEVSCPICSGQNGFSCLLTSASNFTRLWTCHDCLKKINQNSTKSNDNRSKKRAISWIDFCNANNIGDLCHNVYFEDIEQEKTKIDYLRKFVQAPRGIVYMQGTPGTGKTYCCLALCELFTRSSSSCLFYTFDRLYNDYMDHLKTDRPSNLRDKLISVSILVFDDFGVREPPAGLMQLIMEVVNVRNQWSTKGTVFNTNLKDTEFSKFCGDALIDRIKTGQLLAFQGESRRTPISI